MTSQTDRKNGITGNLGIKAPVRCGTTANITLSGLQTIEGITVIADDRVLVKNQTDTTENGVYNASSSAWSRALDFDGINDIVNGTLVGITNGTTQANQIWQLVATNPITIDTSALTFTYILSTNSSDNLSDLAALASVANLETLANLSDVDKLTLLQAGKGADIASASTVNLTTATGEYLDITGTTTITAITLTSGTQRLVRFTGILTLTHGASLVLPTSANITTAAGDFALFVGDASSVVRCAGYFRASGSPLIPAETATESVAGIAEIATAAEAAAAISDTTIITPLKQRIVQQVYFPTGALATGSTAIPYDNTIPQITEGDQYMFLGITPKSASNILKIDVVWQGWHSVFGETLTVALFRAGTSSALGCGQSYGDSTNNVMLCLSFTVFVVAGSTSALTFSVRAGGASGTNTFNGISGSGLLGGSLASSITITEIKA